MKQIPGVLAAVVVMLAGFWLADLIGQQILAAQGLTGSSPVSGVPVAIVLGLLLRNIPLRQSYGGQALALPASLNPGLKFATTTILRAGIVLVGIRLSLFDVVKLGVAGLPVVLAAIATGMIFVTWFNRKLGLPPRLGTLIAAGTSICGVTAIVSTAPAIEADEREVAYAVANVVAFGLFGMLTYPYLAHAVLGSSETIGLFLGTAVHDTSQVVGAALTYKQVYNDDVVLRVATVTKLTRNIFLAAVIPILTWMHVRAQAKIGSGGIGAVSITSLVPGFVVGFLAMAVVRSIGDWALTSGGAAFGVWNAAQWTSITKSLGDYWASQILLGTAMAAVGLNTNFAVFKGVGLKPFVVGMAGALVVGAVGMTMAVIFGRFVHL
jgi:uncharacterized integral membrane protein (TIGR00698 family)